VYHYHANNYANDSLTSITLTIRSSVSGRTQHVTASEDQRGQWTYRHSGDDIVETGVLERRLGDKIDAIRDAQQRADSAPRRNPLDMSLGELVRQNQGTY
jgi:hypothetical protein